MTNIERGISCEMVLEVRKPRPLWEILFSTHHTDIGLLYIIFSLTSLFLRVERLLFGSEQNFSYLEHS